MEYDILCRLQDACDSFRKSDIEGSQTVLRGRLTECEWEITQMLMDHRNAEIAATLHITEQEVKDCLENVYRKLEIGQRYQAAERIRNVDIIEEKSGNAVEKCALWAKELQV